MAFIAGAGQQGSRPEIGSIVLTEERPSRDIASRLGTTCQVLGPASPLRPGQAAGRDRRDVPLDIAPGTPITEASPGPAYDAEGRAVEACDTIMAAPPGGQRGSDPG